MLRAASLPGSKTRTAIGIAVVAALCALVPVQLGARTGSQPGRPDRLVAAGAELASAASPLASAQRQGKDSYVLFDEKGQTVMSGRADNTDRARRFLRDGEPLLWFRRDGREYICRDAAVIASMRASIRDTFRAVSEIDRRQVGRQHGEGEIRATGEPLGDLNAAMSDLHRTMSELEEKLRGLSRDLKRAAAKAEADVHDTLTRAIASGAAREVK